MTTTDDLVVLLDCDNTLLDNDRMQADISERFAHDFGAPGRDRYWAIVNRLRAELGYADYLGALQSYRLGDMNDPRLLLLSAFLLDYPFGERLYPGALEVMARLRQWGSTVILSDGDVVFQPRKIQRAGLWNAVEGRVLISIHKERILDAVAGRFPAAHYIMVDDKLRVLTAMKQLWGTRLTTVFVRQGHYALDPDAVRTYPSADLTVECIGDLAVYDRATLVRASRAPRA